MPSYLCLTIRFLQPYSHGRGEGGDPEWPPSPLRLFQALVAAAAAHWNERANLETAASAIRWLETQSPPSIVAPKGQLSQIPCLFYVPDNTADLIVPSWKRGEVTKQVKRTEKLVRPMHLAGDAVHYLYTIPDGRCPHLDVLEIAVRSITHLGWGIDMVVGNSQVISADDAAGLPGDRWTPAPSGVTPLRVPTSGTLDDLKRKHAAFLDRLSDGGFKPVAPLSAYRLVGYRRATDPPSRPFAAFSLLKPDASGFRAFDPVRRGVAVAGMMRCATKGVAELAGWADTKIGALILGHGEPKGQLHQPVNGPRFAYVPLPSIEYRGSNRGEVVGAIRRAIVVLVRGGQKSDIDWATRALAGVNLVAEGDDDRAAAILSLISNSDRKVRRYTDPSSVWSTVTPVVLPGYDDPNHYRRRLKKQVGTKEQRRLLTRLEERTDSLLRKAIVQAGYSEVLARHAQIDWRTTGFRPGVELAMKYTVPEKLRRFPRLHVLVTWRDEQGNPIELPGPICLGGGRFYGLGLFAGGG